MVNESVTNNEENDGRKERKPRKCDEQVVRTE